MANFAQYLSAVQSALQNQDGGRFAALLDVRDAGAQAAVFEGKQRSPNWDPGAQCRQKLRKPWDEMVAAQLRIIRDLQDGERLQAYEKQTKMVAPFLTEFREESSAWLIRPTLTLAHNLQEVASVADEQLRQQGKKPEKLIDAAGHHMRTMFAAVNQAAGNKDKRLAALGLINTQLRVYFRLNTLRLCKNLTNTADGAAFPAMELFPISQVVTYKYYTGRLAIFDEQYVLARERLGFAFARCTTAAPRNKMRILQYLIPVQLLLGSLPSPTLLEQYNLHLYRPLVEALRTGSIRLLNQALEDNQDAFIQQGVYLLLEKLKFSVYRRLFKRVQLIWAQMNPAKAVQVPMGLFRRALEWQGVSMDLDQCECIVANLIYRKYVKGYISHKLRTVVVAKSDPYPPLSSVALEDP